MSQELSREEWKEQYGALVGIDWADEKHHFHLLEVPSGKQRNGTVDNTPEALREWLMNLRKEFSGRPLAICMEDAKTIRTGLMKYDFIHLYPVNPSKISNFRGSYVTSGAKDDPTDAKLIVMFLEIWGNRLKVWKPDTAETRELAALVEDRRNFVDDLTGISNHLTSTLKLYYPQALKLVGESITSSMALEYLRRWPTLEAVQKAGKMTLVGFYHRHGCRSEEKIAERLALINQGVSETTDPAVVKSCILKVKALSVQIRGLAESIKEYNERINALMEQHPDAFLFTGLKGAGDALAPRLLVAMGTDRERWESAEEIQTLQGIAPIIQKSGKTQCTVRWRWAAPTFLRQTWIEFADQTRKFVPWAKAYYQILRKKGKGHQAALRALAFKWIRILYACWKNRTSYDEKRYLESLRKRGSPIIAFMENNQTSFPKSKG